MQDQRDDAIIGVGSTARRFAEAPRRWLTLFAVLAVLAWGGGGGRAPPRPPRASARVANVSRLRGLFLPLVVTMTRKTSPCL